MSGDVYRIDLPRSDLQVSSQGVQIKPALSLGSYTAFKDIGDGDAMVMGDLVLTEDEYNEVISALQDGGIGQTAVHKHLPQESPALWWTHIEVTGDPVAMANMIRSALDLTDTPFEEPSSSESEDLGFDTAQLDQTIGHSGTTQGGVYKYSIGRADSVTEDGVDLPAPMGISTALNFQPTSGGKAAINGDFAMTQDEVEPVIQALRDNGIQVVSLHNHMLNEEPRIFFMHFWANDDAQTLAQGLRAALDKTNSAKEG
jgi:biotin operon repressor